MRESLYLRKGNRWSCCAQPASISTEWMYLKTIVEASQGSHGNVDDTPSFLLPKDSIHPVMELCIPHVQSDRQHTTAEATATTQDEYDDHRGIAAAPTAASAKIAEIQVATHMSLPKISFLT